MKSPLLHPRLHFTTGSRLKAVSLDRQELAAWGAAETRRAVACCGTCRRDQDLGLAVAAGALPRLARDVLDFLLEAALIHMEHRQSPYCFTLADIVACFG